MLAYVIFYHNLHNNSMRIYNIGLVSDNVLIDNLRKYIIRK